MIDVFKEELMRIADATKAFPVKKNLGLATINRWRLHGIRGAKLECVRMGGHWFTSKEAIGRFIASQNVEDTPAVTITPSQRRKQSEAAQHELAKMGVN